MGLQPLLHSPARIAILGAGLMGRLLAVELARRGHEIDTFDAAGPQAEGAAARVAAAMLAPLAESAVSEPGVVRMGLYALTRWPQLLDTLAQPVYFQRNGTLVLWHRQDGAEAARLRDKLEHMQSLLPELPALQTLDGEGIAQLEPAAAGRFHQALYLPDEGQLDNRQALAALLVTMEQLGVHTHWHSPRAPHEFSPGQRSQPDWVLDCRGLGARDDWAGLRGVRGEVVRLHAPEVTLERPTRLVHPRYPIYIVPKQDHLFVVGATEIESDDLSPASVRSVLELLSAAYTVHSGFAEARIIEIATQCRPALPDDNPGIRLLADRVLQINGLYRHGFMIAPALLDVALELLHDGQSPLAARLGITLQQADG